MSAATRHLDFFLARLRRSPHGVRLARGAFWSLLGSILSRAVNLGASILIARVLTQEAFGAVGVIQSTVGLFGTLAGFGLGTAVTKYVSEYRSVDAARAGRLATLSIGVSCVTGGAVALLLWVFSRALAAHVLAAPYLVHELESSALLVLLGSVCGVQMGVLSGLEAFRSLAAVNLFAGLTGTPLQLIGAWLGGLSGAVWGLVAASFANVIIAQIALLRSARRAALPLSWRNCTRESPLLVRFAVPLVAVGVVVSGANWVCNALVVNQSQGYAEMALLNASSQWLGLVVFVAASMQQGMFPALSESLGRRDAVASGNMLKAVLLISVAAATPFTLVGLVASPWIMKLYGSGFEHGWPVLALTVLTAWVYCLHGALNQFIIASGQVGWCLMYNVFWGVLVVGITRLLVASGAQGLALARVVSYMLVVLIEWAMVRRHLQTIRRASAVALAAGAEQP
jgi:O-antigen/teichoic acid export membrane protein